MEKLEMNLEILVKKEPESSKTQVNVKTNLAVDR